MSGLFLFLWTDFMAAKSVVYKSVYGCNFFFSLCGPFSCSHYHYLASLHIAGAFRLLNQELREVPGCGWCR